MKEDKDMICKELVKVLKLTRQYSDLQKLLYNIEDNGDEIVTAVYEGGGKHHINVTMDSGAAMIRDIMKGIA